MKIILRLTLALLLITLLMTTAQAANFNIQLKSGTSLPTQLVLGKKALAFYTITNNMDIPIPPGFTISDITSPNTMFPDFTPDPNYRDLCTNPLSSLPSNGSCTLKIYITGPTSSGSFSINSGSNITVFTYPLINTQINQPNDILSIPSTLALRLDVPTALTIKNTSSTLWANNIQLSPLMNNLTITRPASCDSLAPNTTCNVVLTATTATTLPQTIIVAGSNTKNYNLSLTTTSNKPT